MTANGTREGLHDGRRCSLVVRVDRQNRMLDDRSEEKPGPVLNSLRIGS